MGTIPSTTPTPRRYSLTWPVVLIAIGFLFLLDQFIPGWGFHRTWPALLILFGVMKLVDSARPPRPPEGPRV